MKKMSNKKVLIIGLGIIAVCLLISLVYMFTNRSVKREPTQQELDAYEVYSIDWQAVTGLEGSDKEIILSLCTYAGEETIGDNVYQTYTSDTLGSYLPGFAEMNEIVMGEELPLYVQYSTEEGDMIFLAYDDAGLCEKTVYDVEADTLYYEQNGTAEVWTKFRSGFQWGKG